MCSAAASGRLPSLTVEVVPSRVAAVSAVLGTIFSPLSCCPRDGCFGETTAVALHPWWHKLADDASGGGEALSSRAPMRRIIWGGGRFFREKSLSAWSTPTRCRLRVASSLHEGRRGYSSSTSLCAEGNPRASALVRAATGALLLQVAAWYSMFRR